MVRRQVEHLTGITLLAPHLTQENCASVLAKAQGKTKREIEVLVCELVPKPDIKASIRKLPSSPVLAPRTAGLELSTAPPLQAAAQAPLKEAAAGSSATRGRSTVSPLAPARYDEARCTFTDAKGKRCRERKGLQFHHDVPYASGGKHEAKNIRLVCQAHNRLEADRTFGAHWVQRKIDGALAAS